MNKMRIAVLSSCLLLVAGSAIAQNDAARKTEELQRSSEQMKPQTNAPAGATNQGSATSTPMSESDRKAEEQRRSSEMMRPPGDAAAGATTRGNAMSTPTSEEDRKAEEARRKTEQMKPQ